MSGTLYNIKVDSKVTLTPVEPSVYMEIIVGGISYWESPLDPGVLEHSIVKFVSVRPSHNQLILSIINESLNSHNKHYTIHWAVAVLDPEGVI